VVKKVKLNMVDMRCGRDSRMKHDLNLINLCKGQEKEKMEICSSTRCEPVLANDGAEISES
jgi:hypothetical protein